MAKQTLNGSLALTKLPQVAIIKKKNKEGKEIDCLLLPIEGNSLTLKDGAVYLDIRIVLSDTKDKYDNDGFVAKSLPSEIYKANKDNEDFLKSNQPILGNVRDFAGGGYNAVSVATIDDSDDNLPF